MFTKKWLDAIVYLAADQWLEDGEETLGLYASIFLILGRLNWNYYASFVRGLLREKK
jgi:hypothetical protein